MPWKSARQQAWGNSDAGRAAMGQDKVDEFNAASNGLKLPERAPKKALKKKPKIRPLSHP